MRTATKGNSKTIAFIQEAVKPTSASVSFISVNFDRLCGNPANSNFRDFEEHHLIWLFRLCLEEIFSIRSLQSSKLRRGMFSSISCKSGLVSISSSQLTDWFFQAFDSNLRHNFGWWQHRAQSMDSAREIQSEEFYLTIWPNQWLKVFSSNLQNSNLRRQLSLKKSTLITLIKLNQFNQAQLLS